MSLESKAVMFESLHNCHETCKTYPCSAVFCPKRGQKYVLLEDAQKEIAENKTEFERNNAFTHKRILELEGVIEAAKNELEAQIFEWQEALKYEVDLDAQQLQEAAITDLKEILALLIPRKEEAKKLKDATAEFCVSEPAEFDEEDE